ncbi:MAG: nucleotidyltransferase family protein [Nitrospira sp.]|nr:nucleotidyltransferase family protein [Nitrospira sp.]MDH4304953.1 nucleotidyltransferase family protein [Nitrospira sp.]MDH5192331.1 nucleotidyltransferase family protein [Nitrospira sp.]
MKTINDIREIVQQHRDVLADKYGVSVVGLFGSYARQEQRPDSDIDLLADILRPISLFELVGAELYLGEVLDTKVDLIPRRDIRDELKSSILESTVAL